MFFFGHISKKKKALQENQPASARKECAPTRKPSTIVHPENVPRTILGNGFPKDFMLYEYGGATLELIACGKTHDKSTRRPALVAKMVRHFRSKDGASVQVEMTASLRDLDQGGNPHADAIAAALNIYYQEKIPEEEREAPIAARRHVSKSIDNPRAAPILLKRSQTDAA